MLIKCPKCGFAQPKDQYCAQCGIDMVAYRPPEKPLSKKLAESLSFQLFTIFLIAVFAIYFIMQNHRDSVWSRIRFLRGNTQIAKSDNANQFTSDSDSNHETHEPSTVLAQVTTTSFPVEKKAAETKIFYLEVPTLVLSKWLEDGVLTRVETSEGITIAYIHQFGRVLEAYGTRIKVLREESFPYVLNQLYTAKLDPSGGTAPATTEKPVRTLANNLPASAPLTAYATIDEERADSFAGQIEISVDPQTSFPVQFEMGTDTSFLISGFSKAKNPDSELVVVMKISK